MNFMKWEVTNNILQVTQFCQHTPTQYKIDIHIVLYESVKYIFYYTNISCYNTDHRYFQPAVLISINVLVVNAFQAFTAVFYIEVHA